MGTPVYNFSAGPATLPEPVLRQAQERVKSLPGIGMSVLEISHRSSWFAEIIEAAEHNVRTLYQLPDEYHVLFLHGGARLQFSMVPINFLRGQRADADYILTGTWGAGAAAEARREGSVHEAWDGASEGYVRVPAQAELSLNRDAVYVHMTSNETIQGVQFAAEPDVGDVPLVCDASSDFLSRPIDVTRYALIYAAAQKNAGPAGLAIVLIRDDMLGRVTGEQHSMLDYRVHAKRRSLFNTPPAFAIDVVQLVTQWLLEEVGGLGAMAALNHTKAQLLYDAIDQSGGFYQGHAQSQCRSQMNVTWRLADAALETEFLSSSEAAGFLQLQGHRSVGGIRASIYNAMPLTGVEALRDFMLDFQRQHAA